MTTHDLQDSELGTILSAWSDTIIPGGSRFITASATIFTDTVNTATWTGHTPQGLTPSASDTATVSIEKPGISLEKTVGLDPSLCAATDAITVTLGAPVVYCYTVTNTGNIDLPTHDLVDNELGALLSSFSYTLTPGANFFVTATTSILTDTTNIAIWRAYTSGGESVSSNDSATVQIMGEADLSLVKSAPGIVKVGEMLTYTLTVMNNGPDSASSITLVDLLPASVSFISASPGCTQNGSVVTCNLGSLGKDASATVIIVVTAPAQPGSLTNNASVSAAEDDPTPGNNSASAVTNVSLAGSFLYLPVIDK